MYCLLYFSIQNVFAALQNTTTNISIPNTDLNKWMFDLNKNFDNPLAPTRDYIKERENKLSKQFYDEVCTGDHKKIISYKNLEVVQINNRIHLLLRYCKFHTDKIHELNDLIAMHYISKEKKLNEKQEIQKIKKENDNEKIEVENIRKKRHNHKIKHHKRRHHKKRDHSTRDDINNYEDKHNIDERNENKTLSITQRIDILELEVKNEFETYMNDNICDQRTIELALSAKMKKHLADILESYKNINDFFTKNADLFGNVNLIIEDLICCEKDVVVQLVQQITEIRNEIQCTKFKGSKLKQILENNILSSDKNQDKEFQYEITQHMLRIIEITEKIKPNMNNFDKAVLHKLKNMSSQVKLESNLNNAKPYTTGCDIAYRYYNSTNNGINNDAFNKTENTLESNTTHPNNFTQEIPEDKNKNTTNVDTVVLESINYKNDKCYYTVICSLHKDDIMKCDTHCLKYEHILCEEYDECSSKASRMTSFSNNAIIFLKVGVVSLYKKLMGLLAQV